MSKTANIDCLSTAQVRCNVKRYLTQTLLFLAGIELKKIIKFLLKKIELIYFLKRVLCVNSIEI